MDIYNLKFNTNLLSRKITDVFNEENINRIAIESGFIIRKGKIDGFIFLDMLLFTYFNHKELSLNDLSSQLDERYSISITKQGIDERFKNTTIKFFTTVLEELLQISSQNSKSIAFTQYEKVRIKDSTCFQLPELMRDKYPGSGGSGSGASIRIQFEYDLKTGEILDLSLNAFNKQDSIDAKETINEIQENDLVIRDLAYTAIKNLQEIERKKAFYLNRLNTTIKVYELKSDSEYDEIDFPKLSNYMKKNKLMRLEKDVYIGGKKLKTRIVVEKLPEKIFSKRIRKAEKNAKKKGRKLGKDYKARAALNIFITNTDLAAESVRVLYTIRWQIELMFKIWKSIGEIDKIKKMKVLRFESYLLAKLIWIAINWQIMWSIIIYFFNERKLEISPYKMFKTFKLRLLKFRSALYGGIKSLSEYINGIIKISPKNHKSEKKKNTLNWSYDIFNQLLNSNDNKLPISALQPLA